MAKKASLSLSVNAIVVLILAIVMLGLGLYIGEGSKTRGTIRIINSDPKVITLAIKWFKDTFGVTDKNFTIAIHLYPDNNVKRSLKYWSKETGILLNQFGKTQIDHRKNKKEGKRGKLLHGTAHLYVRANNNPRHGVFLSRKIKAMMNRVMDRRV